METSLFLCEYASHNIDGTITAIRVGIDTIWGPLPIKLNLYSYARIKFDKRGDYMVYFKLLDEKDNPTVKGIPSELPIKVEDKDVDKAFSLVARIVTELNGHGLYYFKLFVNDKEEAKWSILASESNKK